jgi:hypothetical protein
MFRFIITLFNGEIKRPNVIPPKRIDMRRSEEEETDKTGNQGEPQPNGPKIEEKQEA